MRPNRKQPAINVQGWSRTGNEKPNNWNKQENFKTDEQTGRNKSFQWQPKINNIKKFKKTTTKQKRLVSQRPDCQTKKGGPEPVWAVETPEASFASREITRTNGRRGDTSRDTDNCQVQGRVVGTEKTEDSTCTSSQRCFDDQQIWKKPVHVHKVEHKSKSNT